MKQCTLIASPLGDILLRAEGDALTGLYFVGQKHYPEEHIDNRDGGTARVLRQTEDELAEYFAGERKVFTVAVKPSGTAFQLRVWRELVKIPYGQVESYGGLADRLGLDGNSARAVGAASGRNPVAIIVPCHRVLSAAGDLTGYAGGLERKQGLLALERPAITSARQMNLFGV
ncbi:methylated-DNA--[protein]-cysteine S-methyltransferase [Paraburkholderia saeva]|jgi:methylated-DNA-[protein]-cysteine S-methyltransferase|uniref:Methylated-DNA--protein-cysteine methyltransferase n=1 Tax=Paraburkholderia saeva TaxID=2777537 RepID=A0A9N8X479_9BURK|nr:methylated-DNA--[protein]-cysteine S-methyltransferase [Paraburkholderia saeva]CAG4915252.1 Methylated-DNA--protein-cysteine methyltransferase [Paraburkholderia saeva]CAG4918789.1 Methylated-DNA--protein-cysteine methyltransferase [Paraburkholderia saeva]CAG4922127.1 Methylated-DNA--protein-cysteine methyltransferase [Paraburkholderia saeva]